MSGDIVDRLAADSALVRRMALQRRLLLVAMGGAVLAALLMVPWLGLRPDIEGAYLKPMFWTKFAYTLVFALLGFWAAERLARPGGSIRRPLMAIVALVALTGLAGIVQMAMGGPDSMRRLVMGSTALVCPFYILALAAPIYAMTVLVMRRLAPTRLTLAGFAAGLFSGGVAVWVYAFHCTESGMPFIAIWYTAGVLASGVAGAIIGRFALRWR